jgi:DUF1009 family protein
VCLENTLLGRFSESKTKQVTEDFRQLHKEEIHNLCLIFNVNQKSRMRRIGHVMCEMRNAYEILSGKAEGERLLQRTSGSCADYIRMNFRDID